MLYEVITNAIKGGVENYVVVTASNGCSVESNHVVVTESASPVPQLRNHEMCFGSTLVIQNSLATNSGSWIHEWTDPQGILDDKTKAMPTVKPTTPVGNYVLNYKVVNPEGCEGRSLMSVAVMEGVKATNVPANASICPEGRYTLPSAPVGFSYVWMDESGKSLSTSQVSVAGVYTVYLRENKFGCKGSSTLNLSYYESPKPILHAVDVCPGQKLTLDAGNYASFLWNDNVSTTRKIEVMGDGKAYSVSVKDANGCVNTSNVVTVNTRIAPVYKLNQDTSFCRGGEAILNALDNFASYSWSCDGVVLSQQQFVRAKESGIYRVTVGDGCFVYSSEVRVVVNELPEFDIVDNSTVGTLAVKAHNGKAPYLFALEGGGLSDMDYTYQASYNNVAGGDYVIHVKDANLCENSIPITMDYSSLVIPNYFTPNGDGFNDRWEIGNIEMYSEAIVIIYDRYGKVIIEYSAEDAGWDGTRFGKPMPSDAYWFVITLGRNNMVYKGHVSLVR